MQNGKKVPIFFSFFIVITLAATSFLNITYLNKEKTVSSKWYRTTLTRNYGIFNNVCMDVINKHVYKSKSCIVYG